MRRLTLIGISLAVVGFGIGASTFVLLWTTGETVHEATFVPRGKKHAMRVETIELELGPDMNPMAMNVSVDDNSAGGRVTVYGPDGEQVYGQSHNSSDGAATAVWFFAPIMIRDEGRHRIEVRVGGAVEAGVHLRKNALLLPFGATVAGLGLAFVGFVCLMVSVMRSSLSQFRRASRGD